MTTPKPDPFATFLAERRRPHVQVVHRPQGPKRKPPRWQRRYEQVFQLVMNQPQLSNSEIACATGYSVWHISRIVGSPDFRQRAERARAARDLAHARVRARRAISQSRY